ncbi:hypothetical protein C7I84_15025 [Mesorhizobium ephedrae]|uniref:Uncharacterized protein n=2 Tax=Kumtagia ephedrae TaxID=2116701 RepID=A0A2P7S8G8_9HYPH|nr:hypothetical protein C7I84_15025 [Mesorhizobium ephedrae]
MIVYGDLERIERAADVEASLASALRRVETMPAGIDRHAALVGAFIRAAELVQGVADAGFDRLGKDARSASQESGAMLLLLLAAAIGRSWRRGFDADVDAGRLSELLRQSHGGGVIKTRTAEGFAHYALYPESYLEAARASGLAANTVAIGIRSIGLGLGALVAAALGAAPAISLRPAGHPYDREVRADAELIEPHAADPEVQFAIVDEGPGRSGSSFASVARWLSGHGVAASRIHFFPSHDGQPGPEASAETRSVWDAVRRHPAGRHDILSGAGGLRSWVEKTLGPLDGSLRELSGVQSAAAVQPQPVDTRFARRKFLAHNAEGLWLIKFAGLGDVGERKFCDARALAHAGFGPETVGLCHGFLVQKWVEGRPLGETPCDRKVLLKVLGAYLACRSKCLGAPGVGASLEKLRDMAVWNTSQALGAEAGSALERRLSGVASLEDRVRRIRTDNRLHGWEWLAAGCGLLKIDAVDHCEAHDLIGCQDIAWDVAGAIVEHDLTEDDIATLRHELRRGGVEAEGAMIAAMLPCYLAFQLGLWSTAEPSTGQTKACATSYADKLLRHLRQPR